MSGSRDRGTRVIRSRGSRRMYAVTSRAGAARPPALKSGFARRQATGASPRCLPFRVFFGVALLAEDARKPPAPAGVGGLSGVGALKAWMMVHPCSLRVIVEGGRGRAGVRDEPGREDRGRCGSPRRHPSVERITALLPETGDTPCAPRSAPRQRAPPGCRPASPRRGPPPRRARGRRGARKR